MLQDALLTSLTKLPMSAGLARLPEDSATIIGINRKAVHRSILVLALLHQLGYANAIIMSGGITMWRKL